MLINFKDIYSGIVEAKYFLSLDMSTYINTAFGSILLLLIIIHKFSTG